MKKLSTYLPCALVFIIAIMFAGCGGSSNTLPLNPAVNISTTSLPDGTTNVAYSQTLTATQGTAPYAWSITAGTLPAGLNLDGATGVISGTPSVAGTSPFTVTVTDSATSPLSASVALSITIHAMSITTTTLPSATVGTAYNQALAVVGGTSTYSWAVTAGVLPADLSLDGATGIISGTPTLAGTSNFTVTVTDSSVPAVTASQALSIVVSPVGSPLSITTTTVPAATFGTAYSQALAATGGTSPYSWTLSAGALPRGVTLSAAGVLSGTPLANGTFNFTVMVTDSAVPADTATQVLTLTVNISATVLSGKTIYDANCAGCHRDGIYDTSGSAPNLGLTSLAAFNAMLGGVNHNGNTLNATQITDVYNFASLF